MFGTLPTDVSFEPLAFWLVAATVCVAWLGCWARWRRVPWSFFVMAVAVAVAALGAGIVLSTAPVQGLLLSAGAGALVVGAAALPLLTVLVTRARTRALRRMHLRAVLDLAFH